jgi:nicotinamidase-related amidase
MDSKTVALIIVDMQNDFLHPDGFVPRYSHEIGVPENSFELLRQPIPFINKLADFFHGYAKPVVYVYTAWKPDYSDVAIPLRKMKDKAKAAGALVEGSWGASIIDELKPHTGSHLVLKKAYGGFFKTNLDQTLQSLGVKTLFMTGVATNFCVETTAREAVAYGYDVVIVRDATASYDPAGYQASLNVMSAGFGDVMSTAEVLQAIGRAQ